ncbi:MAG: TolC family protein [Planctomycetes bacterium]|nr:TolC family protein [Planctomycetota bacterium]
MRSCVDGYGLIRLAVLLVAGLLASAAGCQMHVAFGPAGEPGETTPPAGSIAAAQRSQHIASRPAVPDSRPMTALKKPVRRTSSKIQSPVKGRSFKTAIAGRRQSASRLLPADSPAFPPLAGNVQKSKKRVQTVGHNQTPELFARPIVIDDQTSAANVPPAPAVSPELKATPKGKPDAEAPKSETTQIPLLPTTDVGTMSLPEVLQRAGAQSWIVMLAYERINEASAKYKAARVMWVPSLNAGIGYSKHEGRIQDTRGDVIEVNRDSLFLGGGAVTSGAPTAAGSGGPARMFIDLSLADAIFQPRSALSLVEASRAGHHATFNDTLLAASLAYYDVAAAQLQGKLALENLTLTGQLLALTQAFKRSGKGTAADVSRVEVEIERRNQEIVNAQLAALIASAELARLLRLDVESVSDSAVITADAQDILAINFTSAKTPLSELVSQAVQSRPEISRNYYAMQSAQQNVQAERWRPWIPNLHLGFSGGGFGGGRGSSLSGLDGRADIDVLAVWQLKNLGLGTAAARQRVRSRYEQSQYEYYRQRDRVIAEVTKAYTRVRAQKIRIEIARSRESKAQKAHDDSILRIKGLQGIPLEALQSMNALVEARRESLNAAIAHNRAQLTLLRATGRTAETAETE